MIYEVIEILTGIGVCKYLIFLNSGSFRREISTNEYSINEHFLFIKDLDRDITINLNFVGELIIHKQIKESKDGMDIS